MKKRLVLIVTPLLLVASVAGGAKWYEGAQLNAALARMQLAAVKDFNDPESARFRNLSLASDEPALWDRLLGFGHYKTPRPLLERLVQVLAYDPEGLHLCGEVNAKNSFGAYVGYRGFEVIGMASPYVMVDTKHQQIAQEMCAKQENVIYRSVEA